MPVVTTECDRAIPHQARGGKPKNKEGEQKKQKRTQKGKRKEIKRVKKPGRKENKPAGGERPRILAGTPGPRCTSTPQTVQMDSRHS